MPRQGKVLPITKSSFLSFLLLSTLLFLILSSSLSYSSVNGWISSDDEELEDEDEDGVEDEFESLNERSLQIEAEEEQVEIQSQRENETLEDQIEIVFKVSDAPEFRLGYSSKVDSSENELEFEVSFQSLIEFVDSNGNGIYDSEIDEETQDYELDSEYLPIQHQIYNDEDGHEIHTFNTTSEDGIFSLQFFVMANISQVYGEMIVTSEIKLDLAIRNFPFIESNSKLALYTRLEAENEFEIDDETEDEEYNRTVDEKEVDITVGDYTGFFSWKEYALVDQANQTVYSSNVENDDSEDEKIYLNYEQGTKIIHDPKVGIENITKSVDWLIPEEIIPDVLSILTIPKENYLLPVIILTTILVPIAWILSRKNQV